MRESSSPASGRWETCCAGSSTSPVLWTERPCVTVWNSWATGSRHLPFAAWSFSIPAFYLILSAAIDGVGHGFEEEIKEELGEFQQDFVHPSILLDQPFRRALFLCASSLN